MSNDDQSFSTNDNDAMMLHDLLAQYFSTTDQMLVVKWHLTAVVMSSEGKEMLVSARSPGLAPWDVKGLVGYSNAATDEWIAERTREQ